MQKIYVVVKAQPAQKGAIPPGKPGDKHVLRFKPTVYYYQEQAALDAACRLAKKEPETVFTVMSTDVAFAAAIEPVQTIHITGGIES